MQSLELCDEVHMCYARDTLLHLRSRAAPPADMTPLKMLHMARDDRTARKSRPPKGSQQNGYFQSSRPPEDDSFMAANGAPQAAMEMPNPGLQQDFTHDDWSAPPWATSAMIPQPMYKAPPPGFASDAGPLARPFGYEDWDAWRPLPRLEPPGLELAAPAPAQTADDDDGFWGAPLVPLAPQRASLATEPAPAHVQEEPSWDPPAGAAPPLPQETPVPHVTPDLSVDGAGGMQGAGRWRRSRKPTDANDTAAEEGRRPAAEECGEMMRDLVWGFEPTRPEPPAVPPPPRPGVTDLHRPADDQLPDEPADHAAETKAEESAGSELEDPIEAGDAEPKKAKKKKKKKKAAKTEDASPTKVVPAVPTTPALANLFSKTKFSGLSDGSDSEQEVAKASAKAAAKPKAKPKANKEPKEPKEPPKDPPKEPPKEPKEAKELLKEAREVKVEKAPAVKAKAPPKAPPKEPGHGGYPAPASSGPAGPEPGPGPASREVKVPVPLAVKPLPTAQMKAPPVPSPPAAKVAPKAVPPPGVAV
ncbi:zmpB, partial [Symbiodinium sp. CCMP2592]